MSQLKHFIAMTFFLTIITIMILTSMPMKTFKKYFSIIILTMIGIVTISCTGENNLDKATGNISIKLSDAPMHYDQFMEANVTIVKMEIGNSADMNSFVMLSDTPMKYNMLELVNGITETIANTEIQEGRYNRIRLYISSTEMIMNNGKTFTYNMDQDGFSGDGMMQNGMMLNSDMRSIDIEMSDFLTVSDGSHSEYLLDIDVDHSFMLEDVSFVDTGSSMMMNMSGFTFNPTMRFVDMSISGTVEGTVESDNGNVANATISLMHAGKVYTTTHTNSNGHYALIGIPEGTYSIDVEVDGFTMNPVGNEMNMSELNMMAESTLNMDFMLISSN